MAKAKRLQWGRGFAATEGWSKNATASVTQWLQWGRGFAATEGCPSTDVGPVPM